MEENMKTTLISSELTCPSCVVKIEKALRSVRGVSDAHVHFNSGRIEVDYDANEASVERLVKTVRSTGYDSRPSKL
jgi:copper chaperone